MGKNKGKPNKQPSTSSQPSKLSFQPSKSSSQSSNKAPLVSALTYKTKIIFAHSGGFKVVQIPSGYQIILTINWKTGFRLGKMKMKEYKIFENRQLTGTRVEVLLTIHGLFFKGPNVRKARPKLKKFSKKYSQMRAGALKDLQTYFKSNPLEIGYIHKYWTNYEKWKALGDDEQKLVTDNVWNSRKEEFVLVVDEFLKHGQGMGLSIGTYIDLTLYCFRTVKDTCPEDLFRANNIYPPDDQNFSLFSNGKLQQDCFVEDISQSFINGKLKVPKLEFTRHGNPHAIHHICSLTEIKFAFDDHLCMLDNPKIECDCLPKKYTKTEKHRVVIFTNIDRSTVRE